MQTENPLQNAYIGEYVEGQYEFSYDFRNKTTTNLTNDGWLNVSSLTTGSTGIRASSWTAVNKNVSGLATAMSTAKKVTLELQTSITSTSGITSGLVLVSNLSNANQFGFYYDGDWFAVTVNSSEIYKPSHSRSTGTKTITCVFDFENKTYSGNYIGGNGTFSGTLTDAQISGVRNNGYIYLPLEGPSYIQTINITVE